MLTHEPTPEEIAEWKRIFEASRPYLQPNRKSGAELDAYFRAHYPHTVLQDAAFCEIAASNILLNEANAEKLPAEAQPQIAAYRTGDVLVGIDLVTGYIHAECEDIAKVIPIYDDLFVYRGLDAANLQNFFLTAEYVYLSGKKGYL